MDKQYDLIIIGAGVVGNAIARELSKYSIKIAVIEKELDVSMGTSSRNSGVIHSGIHYKPGTLRARLNVLGNSMMEGLCNDLKVECKYIGKLTVARNADEVKTLHMLKEQGQANGVPDLKILNKDAMEKIQPGVGGVKALFSPSTGIINPYYLTIALAENAQANGCDFHLGHEVTSILRKDKEFSIVASGRSFKSKVLINSAGLYSADICNMLGINEYKIYPCRGEYLILDKRLKDSLNVLVYPAPHKANAGLGIHLTNTVSGNILIGPSNEYMDDPKDYACTKDIMDKLRKEGHMLLPDLKTSDFIRSFSGFRPKQNPPQLGGFKEFVVESRDDIKGFINLLGIESPGLTCSPAIALMVKDMVAKLLKLESKDSFDGVVSGFPGHFYQLPEEQKADLVAQNSDYGQVVCRCEQITRKEILDAISNPLGVKTINSIKYRSRAMMGRCQGGFCLPKIVQILEKEFGYQPQDFLLKSHESPLFTGKMRGGVR
jgi:glycerol-3-phosphate dehydrogenase